ncbi:hypothetical protein LTR94_035909, partial [Friedmanniomyces endolithicus]
FHRPAAGGRQGRAGPDLRRPHLPRARGRGAGRDGPDQGAQGAGAGGHQAGTDQPAGAGEPRPPAARLWSDQPLCQGAGLGRSARGGGADPRRSGRLPPGLAPPRQGEDL